jgi:hypothetical protein
MSRSVDYLSGAQAVAYLTAHAIEDEFEWDDFVEDIKYQLKSLFPSLADCDRWGSYYDGKENHIILENNFAEVAIAEYMGLVSVSIRATDCYCGQEGNTALGEHWINQIKNKFLRLGDLHKIGTFSNGEALFETSGADTHTYSSKEGLCEWLEA